ncbi:MAG: hypothetical protein QW199_00035 [Candidatus Pacearchaeota archaeon]
MKEAIKLALGIGLSSMLSGIGTIALLNYTGYLKRSVKVEQGAKQMPTENQENQSQVGQTAKVVPTEQEPAQARESKQKSTPSEPSEARKKIRVIYSNPAELMAAVKSYKEKGDVGTAYYLIEANAKNYAAEVQEVLKDVESGLESIIKQKYVEAEKPVVAVFPFTNYTNKPGIENVIQNFIIDYLVNTNLVRVREGNEGDIVFKGEIVSLEINEQRNTSTMSKRYVSGSHTERIPNQRYNTAVAEMQRICAAADAAAQRKPDNVGRTIDNIIDGARMIESGQRSKNDVESALGVFKIFGSIGEGINRNDEINKLGEQCRRARAEVERLNPYIENEITDYGTATINVVNATKTGSLIVSLRVTIPETGDVIVANRFEASDEYSDIGHDGYSPAGIDYDPLVLPSDSEIIRNLFGKIFYQIKGPVDNVIRNFVQFRLLKKAREGDVEACGLYSALSGKSIENCYSQK